MYTASIDHFKNLDIEYIESQSARSVVEHEFPGRNGALLEDMGGRARRLRFVVWFGIHPANPYSLHRQFLDYLDANRKVTFVHPEYGFMQGRVTSLGERRSDEVSAVAIDVTFVEELVEDATPQPFVDIASAGEALYVQSIEQQKRYFAEGARVAVGSRSTDLLGRTLDMGQGVLAQFGDVSGAARTWIGKVDSFVRSMESSMVAVSQPATSVMNAVAWGTTLPDRVIRAAAATVERYSEAASTLIASPFRFVYSVYSSSQALLSALASFRDVFTLAVAARGALDLAVSYDADEKQRDVVRRLEQTETFDIQGRRVARIDAPAVATVQDLESSLALCREWVQTAMNYSRDQLALKQSVAALTEHVRARKLERDHLVEMTVDPWAPLHLVCHRRGLSYRYATRILALNPSVANPTFTDGKVRVYAG